MLKKILVLLAMLYAAACFAAVDVNKATATELARPDFAALAASFGIPAHVATLDTVGEIVADTFTTAGPAVVVLPALLRMFAPTHL